jgi:hypothetical protein
MMGEAAGGGGTEAYRCAGAGWGSVAAGAGVALPEASRGAVVGLDGVAAAVIRWARSLGA